MSPVAPVPLWRQLQATAVAIAAVRAGRSLTAALERVDAALRPGVQALAFDVLRSLGRAEALRRQLAQRAPPAQADALLCTALALAAPHEGATASYEAFTLVDQTVEAAKRSAGMRQQASFVNACLRRFLRERESLLARTANDPVATWSHPLWWIDRLRHDHPQAWQAILSAGLVRAPMALRVNRRHTTVTAYLEALNREGLQAAGVPGHASAIAMARPCAVHRLPGWADGWVSVQDAAAQLAAPLLLADLAPAGPRLRLLDACAAPGGKTAHLLECADADVLALDIDAARCTRVRDNLARLGLQAEVRAADAAEPGAWWDGRPFDGILLDAPCTASGIVRRHPDVPWLRREGDVAQLADIQARLLTRLWPLLRPGGRLVYATCSVFRAEGEGQIETFVARNKDAVRITSPGHLLPLGGPAGDLFPDNVQRDHDGFYYARLEKARD